jgi:hypothetical protein
MIQPKLKPKNFTIFAGEKLKNLQEITLNIEVPEKKTTNEKPAIIYVSKKKSINKLNTLF